MVAGLRISQLLYGLSQWNGRWSLLLTTEQIHGDEREEEGREVPLEERRRRKFGTKAEPTSDSNGSQHSRSQRLGNDDSELHTLRMDGRHKKLV
jgi:hypothetical protein